MFVLKTIFLTQFVAKLYSNIYVTNFILLDIINKYLKYYACTFLFSIIIRHIN